MNIFPREVLVCGQIFGCFPLIYSKSAKGTTSLVFSWKIQAWSFVVVTVISILSYFALYTDYRGFMTGHPIRMRKVTSALATILDVIPLNILMLTVFFSNYKKRNIFIRIYQMLTQVDQVLHLEQKSKQVKVIAIIGISVFNLSFAAFSNMSENIYFVLYIPFWMTYFIQVSMFLNFTCIMEIIENSFKALNKKIKLTVMEQHFNINLLMTDLGLPKVENTGPHGDLKELMECYSQLYEVLELTNQFFNVQLFVGIVSSFLHNLITLYFFIADFIQHRAFTEKLMEGIWVITHIIHLTFLVWPCTSVENAANETASMVCHLICKNLHPHLKQQLELFLLQLLHYKTKFSAIGFFDVDTQILTSIASSVTTYLVILIQFRLSER